MKTILFALTFLFLSLAGDTALAITPVATVEQSRATADSVRTLYSGDRERDYLAWTMSIEDIFKVPISFEWSYVNEDGSDEEIPKIPFEIRSGESLSEVLDNFCKATDNRLQWGRIQGILWVWPSGSEGKTDSLLDMPVSVNVQSVSTWDAFLALSLAINAGSNSGRYVAPSANPIQDEFLPPIEFREENSVTLDMSNRPAREVASEIMARSYLHMRVWYTNSYRPDLPKSTPKASLSLWAFDEKYRMLKHVQRVPSRDEEIQWYNDAKSVIPPLTEQATTEPE